MGVSGLRKFITTTREAQSFLSLPSQDGKRVKVIIDSLSINMAKEGYAAFLQDKDKSHSFIYDDSDILGGEAAFLAKATRNLLITMRDHLKLEIYLLSDGARFKEKQQGMGSTEEKTAVSGTESVAAGADAYQARNDELAMRRRGREEEVRNIFNYARGLSDEKAPPKYPNAPPQDIPAHNFGMIVRDVVQKLNEEAKTAGLPDWCQIHTIRSVNAEADEEVGKLVAENNIDLIITSDTDMVVINHGADVTFFSELPLQDLMAKPQKWKEKMHFPISSHAQLCAALSLTSPSPSSRTKSMNSSREQRQQREDLQQSLVDKFIQSPNDDSLLLYLACGFMGNDITKPITDRDVKGPANVLKNLKMLASEVPKMSVIIRKNEHEDKFFLICCLLRAAREIARRESLAKSSSSGAPSPSKYRVLAFFEKWLLGSTSLLAASTNQYLQSANIQFPESKLPQERFLDFHPEVSLNRSELFFFYSLFLEGTIGATFTYLVEGLPTEEEVEDTMFYYRGAGCDHSFRKLKTVVRLYELRDVLIQAQRKALGMKSTIETPKTTWYEVYRKSKREKQVLLRNVLNPEFPSVREAIDAAVSSNPKSDFGSPFPTITDVILWLLYPVLDEVELRLMSAILIFSTRSMKKIYKFVSDVQNAVNNATSGSPLSPKKSSGRVNKRPSPRALELAKLYSDAVCSLEKMATFLGFPSVNSMFSPSCFSFSRILESWSGSLFYYLYEHREHLELLPGISDLIDGSAVQKLLENVRKNGAEFKVVKVKEGQRTEEVSSDLGAQEALRESLTEDSSNEEELDGDFSIRSALSSDTVENKGTAGVKCSNSLPILDHINNILSAVRNNNVVCIQGETGCGKSSRIPLKILEEARLRRERVRIVVTQPRRLAATSLAKYVASLLGEKVGKTVGFRLGGGRDFHLDSIYTCILFVTTGYLLESLLGSPKEWKNVTHFILDEVHERSLETDMLSLIIKLKMANKQETLLSSEVEEGLAVPSDLEIGKMCSMRRGNDQEKTENDKYITHPFTSSKVIIMSATIQATLFQRYFAPVMQSNCLPPEIYVGAKRFPVKEYFLEDIRTAFPQLPRKVLSNIEEYGKSLTKGRTPLITRHISLIAEITLACVHAGTSVLVFLPGLEAIVEVAEELRNLDARFSAMRVKLNLFPAHSSISLVEQQKCISEPTKNECNIILATNIAETSITIPSLRTVIDLGLSKQMVYDEQKRMRVLDSLWCSKSSAKQRAGRAGRVAPGLVVRMYPKKVYESIMPDFDTMDHYNLEYSVLQFSLRFSHLGDVRRTISMLLEPPDSSNVREAIRSLKEYGALDDKEQVTPFGEKVLRMPVDMRMTHGLLLAAALGCAAEMLVILAGLTMQKSFFASPLPFFYDSESEFLKEVISVTNTSHQFEKTPLSDIDFFLSLWEFSMDPDKKKYKVEGLAWRALTSFKIAITDLAGRFCSLNLTLDPVDQEYIHNLLRFGKHSGKEAAFSRTRKAFGMKMKQFRALCSSEMKSQLQMVLCTFSQGLYFCKPKREANTSEKVFEDSCDQPPLASLPEGTKKNLSPVFLKWIEKIRPILFFWLPPSLLCHYLCRTVIFGLESGLEQKILNAKKTTSGNADRERGVLYAWDNSVVSGFQEVLEKLFSVSVFLTVSLEYKKVVLTVDLGAMGIHPSRQLFQELTFKINGGDGTTGKVGFIKNSKTNGPTPPDEGSKRKKMKSIGETPTTSAKDNTRVSFGLLGLHSRLRGLCKASRIVHEKLKVPSSLNGFEKRSKEAQLLPHIVFPFRAYTFSTVEPPASRITIERQSTLSTLFVLPVLPTVNQATEDLAKTSGLCGTGEVPLFCASFSVVGTPSGVRLSNSAVLSGRPYDVFLSLANSSIMLGKINRSRDINLIIRSVSKTNCNLGELTFQYITGIEEFPLHDLFNTVWESYSIARDGAPIHVLVSLLALSILSHISKYSQFLHEASELAGLIHELDGLSLRPPFTNHKDLKKPDRSLKLTYEKWKFLDGSAALLPDVGKALQHISSWILRGKNHKPLRELLNMPSRAWEIYEKICGIQNKICVLHTCTDDDMLNDTKRSLSSTPTSTANFLPTPKLKRKKKNGKKKKKKKSIQIEDD